VANSGRDATVVYKRPSSDEILLDVQANTSGFVNALEAYDPGWLAQVDGRPTSVFPANGLTLATPVSAGKHAVRFRYYTPGKTLGVALSLSAVTLLAFLIWLSPSAPSIGQPGTASAVAPGKPVVQSGLQTDQALQQRHPRRRRRFGK
jgi:hypothetical protein